MVNILPQLYPNSSQNVVSIPTYPPVIYATIYGGPDNNSAIKTSYKELSTYRTLYSLQSFMEALCVLKIEATPIAYTHFSPKKFIGWVYIFMSV